MRWLVLFLVCSSLWATGPVAITGTIYTAASGGTANGTMTVENPVPFTATDGHYIGPTILNYKVTSGVPSPSISLEPSSNASPAFSYKVTYKFGSAKPIVCYWLVPGTTQTISAVETCTPPSNPGSLIPPSQISAGGGSDGECLVLVSGVWTPSVACGSVTTVGSGNLTNTAIVTGGGLKSLQTPAATATLDSSGNISTPGTLQTGAGSSAIGVITTNPKLVSDLPTCNSGLAGAHAVVTDATATTFHSTVVGMGGNVVPVLCTGSAWVIG